VRIKLLLAFSTPAPRHSSSAWVMGAFFVCGSGIVGNFLLLFTLRRSSFPPPEAQMANRRSYNESSFHRYVQGHKHVSEVVAENSNGANMAPPTPWAGIKNRLLPDQGKKYLGRAKFPIFQCCMEAELPFWLVTCVLDRGDLERVTRGRLHKCSEHSPLITFSVTKRENA